jgi:hypothetical protein
VPHILIISGRVPKIDITFICFLQILGVVSR